MSSKENLTNSFTKEEGVVHLGGVTRWCASHSTRCAPTRVAA